MEKRMTELARSLDIVPGAAIQAVGLGVIWSATVSSAPARVGPFGATTTVVRIKPRTGVCVRAGDGTVDATVNDSEMDSGDVEYIRVDPGGYLSFVKQTGASDGIVKVTEGK